MGVPRDEFTRKERETLMLVFHQIERALTIQLGSAGESNWSQAFDYERRGRAPVYARALLIIEFANGARAPWSAAKLWSLSPGIRTAHCAGAAFAERAPVDAIASLLARCDEVIALKAFEFVRRVDKLDGRAG